MIKVIVYFFTLTFLFLVFTYALEIIHSTAMKWDITRTNDILYFRD